VSQYQIPLIMQSIRLGFCAAHSLLLRAIGTYLKLRLQIVASCWHTPEAEIFHEGFWAMLHA